MLLFINLKAVFKVLLVIRAVAPIDHGVNECNRTSRPEVGRHTLNAFFGKSLQPGKNGMLFVHGKMHRNLKWRDNWKNRVRETQADDLRRLPNADVHRNPSLLTSASAGFFFFHHLVMARGISRLGFKRGRVREIAPIIDMVGYVIQLPGPDIAALLYPSNGEGRRRTIHVCWWRNRNYVL